MDTNAQSLLLVAESICKELGFEFKGYANDGGFKSVYKVQTTNGYSALKIIKSTTRSPRTTREMDAIKRCRHPNISALYHTGEYESDKECYQYSVEEFIGGGTLREHVKKNGFISRSTAIKVLCVLGKVLEHLDELDLVHRDIKPENIMFREVGFQPVLVDFGSVRDLSAVSLTQTWAPGGPGTPFYASPEQLNNNKSQINWRSDQFSLGVTISRALFGPHPYDQGDDAATIGHVASYQARNTEFLSAVKLNKLEFLKRMTEPWPIDRFRTPKELNEALSKIAED